MNPSTLFVIISMMIVSPLFSGEPDKKLHEKCIYPTVMISNAQGSGSSTGTIVRSEEMDDGTYHNVVITTAHGLNTELIVASPHYKNWSELEGGQLFPATIYYTNSNADIAIIIFMSGRPMHVADFGFEEKIYIGNKVVRIGCGLADAPRLEEGIITGINLPSARGVENKIHRMSIHTLPGDSGGSLHHNYKIIGLTQSIRTVPGNHGPQPIYHYSMAVRLRDIELVLASEAGGLDFVKEGDLPVFGYFLLSIKHLTQGQQVIPASPWL